MKQVMAARTDLGMGRGKLTAQVAHASLQAYEEAGERARTAWKGEGQKKVVVKVSGESELLDVADRARTAGLPYAVVRDAGHTQLEPGTLTTVGIGPTADEEVDRITGNLSLYG
jgi:PTH2 family peptidyl-tRNA hydrolase